MTFYVRVYDFTLFFPFPNFVIISYRKLTVIYIMNSFRKRSHFVMLLGANKTMFMLLLIHSSSGARVWKGQGNRGIESTSGEGIYPPCHVWRPCIAVAPFSYAVFAYNDRVLEICQFPYSKFPQESFNSSTTSVVCWQAVRLWCTLSCNIEYVYI